MVNVLFVDDSPLIRKMLRRHVNDSGIQLGEMYDAGDGRQALKVLEANHVDLMFCDVNMPEMNGFELLEAIHERGEWASLIVIMVTTESGRQDISKAVGLGAKGYVRKPFTPEEVIGSLKDGLAQRAA